MNRISASRCSRLSKSNSTWDFLRASVVSGPVQSGGRKSRDELGWSSSQPTHLREMNLARLSGFPPPAAFLRTSRTHRFRSLPCLRHRSESRRRIAVEHTRSTAGRRTRYNQPALGFGAEVTIALSCPRVMESSPSCCILAVLSWMSPAGGANIILMVTKSGMCASHMHSRDGLRIQQGQTTFSCIGTEINYDSGNHSCLSCAWAGNLISMISRDRSGWTTWPSAMASDEERCLTCSIHDRVAAVVVDTRARHGAGCAADVIACVRDESANRRDRGNAD